MSWLCILGSLSCECCPLRYTQTCTQAVLNYEEMLTGRPAVAPLGRRTSVEAVLLTQRDAALCASMAAAAAGAAAGGLGGPSGGESAKAGVPRRPAVVGVLGEAHLQGVLQLWQGARWREVLREAAEEHTPGEAARSSLPGSPVGVLC